MRYILTFESYMSESAVHEHPCGYSIAEYLRGELARMGYAVEEVDNYRGMAWSVLCGIDSKRVFFFVGWLGLPGASWQLIVCSTIGTLGRLLGHRDDQQRLKLAQAIHAILSRDDRFTDLKWYSRYTGGRKDKWRPEPGATEYSATDPTETSYLKEPDFVSAYGYEHGRLSIEAAARDMTQDEFEDWVNAHPEWFELEFGYSSAWTETRTPVQIAGKQGRLLVAIYLRSVKGVWKALRRGADVNAVDENGRSPLVHAILAERSDPNIVQLLIEHGADVNIRDRAQQWSPLHFAVRGQHVETARILLEGGAEVNVQDIFGNSPLMRAVLTSNSDTATVKVLLDHGADRDLKNYSELSPAELARTLPESEVARVLTGDNGS